MTATATATARSAEASYAALAERFHPVFARIAEGALEREQQRQLPFEQVKWLKDAGFTTLRVPADHGGEPDQP